MSGLGMGNLKTGHIIEAVLWLSLAAFLYAASFEFNQTIEIYKFGASAWPRMILLLIVIAALGQLAYNWKVDTSKLNDNESEVDATPDTEHIDLKWYLSTFFLLALPIIYIVLPQSLQSWLGLDKSALHTLKLACAALTLGVYLFGMRGNLVGAMLALPIFFGALMQDFGFYALAPFFAAGVMYLMGERRVAWIAAVTSFIIGLLLFLFVSLLYVGLPSGNISPFYELGTGVVNLLQ